MGLALMFMYAALSSFRSPNNWIGFFPSFVLDLIPSTILLTSFSVIELIVAVWLISGKYTLYAALVSAAMLLGIVIFNLGVLDVVFRDVGLGFAAIALAVLHYKKKMI